MVIVYRNYVILLAAFENLIFFPFRPYSPHIMPDSGQSGLII